METDVAHFITDVNTDDGSTMKIKLSEHKKSCSPVEANMTSKLVLQLVKGNEDCLQRSLNQPQLLLIYAMNGCVSLSLSLSSHTQETANAAVLLSQPCAISSPYNTALTRDTANTAYYPYI